MTNISKLTVEGMRKQLADELIRQGVQELWTTSKHDFHTMNDRIVEAGVVFNNRSKKFDAVPITNAMNNDETNYGIAFYGTDDRLTKFWKTFLDESSYFLVWKDGKWCDGYTI